MELRAKLTSKEVDINPTTEQEINQDVSFMGRGEVISKVDRGDHHVMVISPQEIYVSKNEGSIPKPETTSGGEVRGTTMSQKLRLAILRNWEAHYSQKYDFEAFYEATVAKIIANIDAKTEELKIY